jgi:beta-glucanase (GH16 family)
MTKGTVPGDWTEQYAGSGLDLSAFRLSFSDEFDTMDVVPNNGSGTWFAPVHAPFGAAKFISPDAATNPFSVANGQLTVSMSQVNGVWQSGTMQTVNSSGQGFAQEYGYFEMRAAFHGGAGSWPAFWLLPQDTSIPRPEVDIVEAYGGDPDGHHQAVHVRSGSVHDWDSNYSGLASSMFDGTFHTYGAMITTDWIIVYFDGAELSRFPMNDFFRTPLYMVVSLAMDPSGVAQASGAYDMVLDYVRAYAAPDVTEQHLQGTDGANNLAGGTFNDTLVGGAGNDRLSGGPGADTMHGGTGNDIYYVDNAGDRIDERGGSGTDRVLASVTFSLANAARVFGAVENLTLTGASAINATGNALNNVISGNAAANVLRGAAGNDTLKGMGANDTLYGGAGIDRLVGGAGRDKFVFNSPLTSANADVIGDFSHKDDTIQIENAIFKGMGSGLLKSKYFHAGTAAHDADDHIVYDKATGALYYDRDGTGPHAQVLFATITNHAHAGLAYNDFVLI